MPALVDKEQPRGEVSNLLTNPLLRIIKANAPSNAIKIVSE